MKTSPTPRRRRSGFSLIELAIVILVLLLFLGMTWISVSAWKRGSDRANCVLNIRHMQLAVRGYANSNSLVPGDATPAGFTTELIGPDKFLSTSPECPAGGNYSTAGDVVPALGSLYMTCSLEATDAHIPGEYEAW